MIGVAGELRERFTAAVVGGDVQGLMDLMAPNVVVLSDGGGKVRAARRPVEGADAAARLLIGIAHKAAPGLRLEDAMINGVPGWRAWDGEHLAAALQLVIIEDRIAQVLIMMNPDKLGGLAEPRADRPLSLPGAGQDGAVPEGDSVYVLARRLDVLNGRTLTRGELRVPQHATDDLSGRTVLAQVTHGKHLLTRLGGELTLHTHLRMDGSWTVVRPGRSLPRQLMPDVRVLLATEDGPTAYGLSLPVVDLVRTADEDTVIGHLGPDPLRDDWDLDEAVRRLGTDPARPITAALLDQRNLAGLGNLWVNELCFLRGVSPWTPVAEVDLPATVRLAVRALRHSALHPGRLPGHHGGQPSRPRPLGQRQVRPALPALRHLDRDGRRGAERPRPPAHLVVPALPARARPRTALIALVVLDEADDVALGVADVDPAHDLRHRLDLPDL